VKAVQLHSGFGIDDIHVVDRPEPKPGPGEVLVRMKAFSLNYRDLLLVKGQYNPKLKLPITLLSDGMGEVAAVGDGVTRFKVGDRVAGTFAQRWISGEINDEKAKSALCGSLDGVLAEYRVFHEEGLVAVPPHLSDEESAALPCAAVTAWNALVTSGGVKAGDVILTQGTGGVSLFAMQFAKTLGARVIITSSRDDKLARARELGASEGINYKTTAAWEEKARELTGGVGVDHVVELGGAGTFAKSLRAVRTGGTISLVGVLAGSAGEINPVGILMKSVRVQGIYIGSREMFEAMNRAITLHHLKPVVDRVFPAVEIRDALHHMESASHFGKICLRW
jgi:NADPH:quinone reductase-like Zn-dependent oxidoreductase